jgi:hypothetical protein
LAEQAHDCGEAVGETLREDVSDLLHVPNMAQEGVGAKGEMGDGVVTQNGHTFYVKGLIWSFGAFG